MNASCVWGRANDTGFSFPLLFSSLVMLRSLYWDCATTEEDLVILWPEVFRGDVFCGDGGGLFKDVLFLEGLFEEELLMVVFFESGLAF